MHSLQSAKNNCPTGLTRQFNCLIWLCIASAMDNVRTRFIGRREATAYFPNTSYSTQTFVQPPSIEIVPAPKRNVRNYSYGKTQIICKVFFSYHDNDQDKDLQKDKYKDTQTQTKTNTKCFRHWSAIFLKITGFADILQYIFTKFSLQFSTTHFPPK